MSQLSQNGDCFLENAFSNGNISKLLKVFLFLLCFVKILDSQILRSEFLCCLHHKQNKKCKYKNNHSKWKGDLNSNENCLYFMFTCLQVFSCQTAILEAKEINLS